MSINSLTGFKAMCGCLTGLTVIAVVLRFVARKKNQTGLKVDDWFMLAALICFLGCLTTVYLLARVGFSGYNSGNGSPQVYTFVQQVIFAFKLITIWTLGAAKASVLFFYKRMFCQNRKMNRVLRVFIIATLIINACWVIGFFILGLFQCGTHFPGTKNHFQSCTLINRFQNGFYISDIILDVWIMVMPIPYIVRLNMSLSKKWLTIVVFLLSFVGLGASIARLVNFSQTPHVDPASISPDSPSAKSRRTSLFVPYLWFSVLEMGTAIVAINLPILYGLVSKHAPEALLRVTRSWTSITSRAFSASDRSSVGRRRGSDISGENREYLKPQPLFNGASNFVGTDTGRTLPADDAEINGVCVHETVQTYSEKPQQEV